MPDPIVRLLVPGVPRSVQGSRSRTRYLDSVRDVAVAAVPNPLTSNRLSVRIVFASERGVRPDVDNVAKPILDALAGIVYQDDRQVQELTISAIPRGEVFRTEFLRPASPLDELLDRSAPHFLIEVFDGYPFTGF